MSYSVSSFDMNDFIDLDTALIEEELRSLGATPENRDYHNDNYRISFKSVDAKEAERLRTTLITPMTYCSITPRSLLKTPEESVYAENHIDLVSSNLQDFMDHCDMDDLLSRAATSRPSSSSSAKQPYRHNKDSLTSIDSEGLSKLHQNTQVESSLPKRHSMMSIDERETALPKSKLPKSKMPVPANKDSRRNSNIQVLAVPSTTAARRRNSNLQQPTATNTSLQKRESSLQQPAVINTTEKRRNSSLQQPTAISSSLKRRDSSLQSSPALNAIVTVKRRNSKLQQPSATKSSLQRRDSNLSQPAISNTTVKRRSSSLQQPAATTNATLERRNSSLQQRNQQDQRRWSSYVSEQGQKLAISKDLVSEKEVKTPQRTSSINANHETSYRQEAKKLSNRNSMIIPTSRRLSREELYENVVQPSSIISAKNVSYKEPTQPLLTDNLADLSEKARRRHTISASDRNANLGQLFKQIADRKASLYGATHIQPDSIHENYYQYDVDHQMQKRHTLSSDRKSYIINTSSYERSVEEPNRYRSRLHNPSKDDNDQASSSSTLRSAVLGNSKHAPPGDSKYQIHSHRYSDFNAQADSEEDDNTRYQYEVSNQDYHQTEQHIVPLPRYSSRMHAKQRHSQLPADPAPAPAPAPAPTSTTVSTTQRRHRAASMPLNQQRTEEEYSTPEKPSFMVVSGRYRKHSNSSISKYASVPENAGLTSFAPPKDTRHGTSTAHTYPEIQVEASRSSGGLSNSTASSSRSSDKYYDPPTPPTNAVVTHQHSKRRSMPVFNASMIDEQVNRAESRYSSYLARIQSDNGSTDYQEPTSNRRMFPHRQRVVSEDNEYYKYQFGQQRQSKQQTYRDEETEDVISSAKHLLSLVKERRNRAH
ncbi:hypothetical protein BD408DRAFT_400787 [Parasitella parasitica]|nr:hypothetical protein BD408DRAFT_400787 [Parasitella parasitica]